MTGPEDTFDLHQVLAGIETLATQRPVAASVVSTSHRLDTSAADLARVLGADLALAGRVMRLANSAYYGMGGRVSSLQFAVTVVGFATVRTMAAVALTGPPDPAQLPAGFWRTSTCTALAASALAPRFGERPQDALCTGLLAQLGAGLLATHDPDGYAGLLAAEPSAPGRRRAEVRRYGLDSARLTALALEEWGFPPATLLPLRRLDDPTSVEGALLRGSAELTARLTTDQPAVPIEQLTCGRVSESEVPAMLEKVWAEIDELQDALVG